ncbi:MAG: tRNA glutamyl-Q(34) synthetase GluQRS [Immundisolibacter sp.]|uniref:tRNA glutamyl-Q(34) synthetase GluQRS n=1 Tax=Immundisolibacter sp. TaxID=1934948 RepID=UPI003EDFBF2D
MPDIRGRFAPSPSGPLHLGSLLAAVGSYLTARSAGGHWLLRMEDLDPPRVAPGAGDAILRALEAHGLLWDEEPLYQSRRGEAYRAAIAQLQASGLVYPCACTRRELATIAHAGVDGPVYPGTCRDGLGTGRTPRALRVRVADQEFGLVDIVQGDYRHTLPQAVGDFVVQRADGLIAYQLAVVVDDAYQGITQVARGIDLLSSTPRQIYLQSCLGLPTPSYAHLPLLVDRHGAKLGKQTSAAGLDPKRASANLSLVLQALRHAPPGELHGAAPTALLQWATQHWQPGRLAGQAEAVVP